MTYNVSSLFDLKGKVAVITGGGGILCGETARALADLGVKVAVADLSAERAEAVAEGIRKEGGQAMSLACNVTEIASLQDARKSLVAKFGPADILVNGAGGNNKNATTGGTTVADTTEPTFFGLDADAIRGVLNLNLLGTILPTQAFAADMVARKSGVIINIASMAGIRPLTKVMGYSASKAAIENLTRWLAVHFAPAGIRVNAIAPGFLLTEQNRFLMTDEKTGELTPRGKSVVTHTPMGRLGEREELIGALVYLASGASGFVTGTTLAVDGGFAAQSGV